MGWRVHLPGIHAPAPNGLKTPPEVYNWHLLLLGLVASGGGIIFGYDLAFVSGVFSLPSFLSRFHLDAQSASSLQTNVLATFQAGAFFGVIFCYWFNERYGRRIALIMAGCIFNIGVIMQLAAHGNHAVFYVGRILSGFGVGASTFISPQYLSETSPPSGRGAVIGFFEIGIQVGSIVGFWINFGVNQHMNPKNDAQWMVPVSMQLVPVTVMIIGLAMLHESPRWLYLKGKRSQSIKSLTWLRKLPQTHPYVAAELNDYERQMEHELDITTSSGFQAIWRETFSKQVRFRLFIGCFMQILLNSTGVNALNYFIVTFFQSVGYTGTSVKLLASGIYGIVKGSVVVVTYLLLVDRFGRRPLIFAGTVGIAFSMYYIAGFASITDSFHSTPPPAASKSAIAFIYLYGASYSLGWSFAFIIAAEIFPNRVRTFCMTWTTAFHWIGEFYTSYSVAFMLRNITYGTFLFYGSITVLGGVFVFFFVPETNGMALEDMDILFEAKGFARQQMRTYREWKKSQQVVIEGKDVEQDEQGTDVGQTKDEAVTVIAEERKN
ncbi:MFS quinate transporter QutD [Rhizodiscina lignyota]|uniref:Quinate transporter n=1 Tax=Rhizodiscina lignyota TaxID=1504668 RepID=A0A9P4I1K1_9PEZI|nr:MFS quinate transporter QutD [Rhizodiscina lignyota]